MAKADRTLEKYRAEWRKSRRKFPLGKALAYCRERRVPEPAWLREAIYEFGRDQILGMKKTGRRTDLLGDDVIYSTVEDYRQAGLTQDQAFVRTAQDFFPRDSKTDRSYTVKSAWLRHQKRIIKLDPAKDASGLGWRIKRKYVKNDKNAALAENIPPYLHTKN